MKQKTNTLTITLALVALVISACGSSGNDTSSAVLTEAALIYAQSLTETAGVAPPTATATAVPPTATFTPELPTFTPTVTGTLPTATSAPTEQPASNNGGSSSNAPCLRANFELETIPDGTQFFVGHVFTKTWRIKNTGSCTWTADFVAVWVQGDLMGAKSVNPFTDININPGEYAEIAVDMVAPGPAGHYKGYWMLRSDKGQFFGVGIDGKSWLWVDIESLAPIS